MGRLAKAKVLGQLVVVALVGLGLSLACSPTGGGGGSGGGDEASPGQSVGPQTVSVTLGETGVLRTLAGEPATRAGLFAPLGSGSGARPTWCRMHLRSDDIQVSHQAPPEFKTPPALQAINGTAEIRFAVDAGSAADDSCLFATELADFDVTVSNGVPTVAQPVCDAPAEAVDVLAENSECKLCVTVVADFDGTVVIKEADLEFGWGDSEPAPTPPAEEPADDGTDDQTPVDDDAQQDQDTSPGDEGDAAEDVAPPDDGTEDDTPPTQEELDAELDAFFADKDVWVPGSGPGAVSIATGCWELAFTPLSSSDGTVPTYVSTEIVEINGEGRLVAVWSRIPAEYNWLTEGGGEITMEMYRFYPLVNSEVCVKSWLSSEVTELNLESMRVESAVVVPSDAPHISLGWVMQIEGTKPDAAGDRHPFEWAVGLRIEQAEFEYQGNPADSVPVGFFGEFESIEVVERPPSGGSEGAELHDVVRGLVTANYVDCPDPELADVLSQEEVSAHY